MRALLLSIALAVGAGLPAIITPAIAYDEQAIRADCDEQWGDDFTMVAYCRDEESSAGKKVDELLTRHAGSTTEGKIVRDCQDEWGTEYTMVVYCWGEESGANQWLTSFVPEGVPAEIVERIRSRCDNEWGSEYTMVQYCINEQVDAWRSLQ